MEEIKSRKNPLIAHMKKLGVDSDYRYSHMEFVCDGEKLLYEAVANGADIKTVILSGKKPDWLPDTILIYKVEQDIIDSVSPLKNPQNVIFSCGMSKPDEVFDIEGFHIVLEGIQDPGNVGTIIRTAAAFNIKSVILTGACADPYNPKTIRATMGALFRQRLSVMDFGGIIDLKLKGLRFYGASLGCDSLDIRDIKLENCAVAIGSEGRGLSEEILKLCDGKIIIPMAPQSESLNAAVAAAIVMWEASKGSF